METGGHHAHDLSQNTALVQKILVAFIRDGVHNAGMTRGVIGLSGGVDSAVAAYLAAEALGKENLLGVLMPYRESSSGSRDDAGLVVSQLGIRSEVVDISPMVDPYVKAASISEKIRLGNVLARQRMIVLYDLSGRENGLVIGTSNKTEILLGYGTLFGDTACALNPLGDLYKTQIWQLARSLGVPEQIIAKVPSADLWAGQTDEEELGFTYKEVDQLLYCMVDERHSDDELAAMGFAPAFIRRVRELIRRNQFKRRPPLIAKVTNRTVNVDFRYARDWGM